MARCFHLTVFPIISQDKTLSPEPISEPTSEGNPKPAPESATEPTPEIFLLQLRQEF